MVWYHIISVQFNTCFELVKTFTVFYIFIIMENKNYYIYVYLDPRKSGNYIFGGYEFKYEPIYVGKGIRNRMNQHLSNVNKNKTSLFYNKLRKIINSGFEPIRVKLIEGLNEYESLLMEIMLIKLIGRIDIETGTLCNMTEGGEVGFKRTEESKRRLSESKRGEKNPMFGKTTSQKQKDAVNEARRLGKIKLSDTGRQKIIDSGKKRRGKKNTVVRFDIKTYKLTSPNNEEYVILGAKNLQQFCKEKKLQYHVLKNNIGVLITEKEIIGKKINAKNTIGWKINLG
jgi:hypothetical protein